MGRHVFQDDDDDDRKTHCCGNRDKNKCIEDWSSFPSEEFCPIRMIIETDDADKFDIFLRKSKLVFHKDDEMLKYANFEMCPYGILGKICHHRAYKCATLLLSRRRKVGSLMKLNIVNCYGSYPIHDAAISLSASLVKLFLDHGASLDARSLDLDAISPLEYAVERLSCDRNLISWSPSKSLFKLIFTLCLPQMKEALKTIDLLAGVSAASTVMNDTISSAVKRGQVVPVAVLLLLAQDKVMKSFYQCHVVSGGRSLRFPEAIMNELATLINQESALMGNKEHAKILQLCREKKELMIYFLKMIEIFNRVGPALKSYLKERTSDVTNEEVSYHVTELLKGAGFMLSTDDHDMSDITSSSKPDLVPLESTLKQQGYDEEDDPNGIFFKPCREQLCRCDMRIPSCTTSAVFQRIVGTSFLYNHHRGFSSCAGPSIHQPMWTVPRRDICSLAHSPNMLRGYKDSLDIRNCNALAGTIFRVLDGRKVEELNLENTRRFRFHFIKTSIFMLIGNKALGCSTKRQCTENKKYFLSCWKIITDTNPFVPMVDYNLTYIIHGLEYCFEEAVTLTALEEKGPKKQAEEKQWSTPGSSLHSLTTAVKSGVFYPLSKAFEHLDVKKISSLVFSAVKKGKA